MPDPTRIGDFDVLRQIGTGGMGTVYLGRDPRLDRQVAIKVVRAEVNDQEVLDRFFREARAAAALRHPNIVTIYASGKHGRQPYMAMEYVDGESLAEVIRQRRNLMLSDKLSYLEQLCAGLHFAHLAGIVHRDVKPANIMVDRQGVVRILDFGIARMEGSAMTLDGTMVGSLNYMSPEQMLGRPVDHRSDMFSVGSVAYELLVYQQAFKGGMNDGLLQRLPNEDPPRLCAIRQDISPELENVVMRALKKAPEDRYPDMEAMREAILEIQNTLAQDDIRTILVRRKGPAALPPQPPDISLRNEPRPDPARVESGTPNPNLEPRAPEPAWAARTPNPSVAPPAPSSSASRRAPLATPRPTPAPTTAPSVVAKAPTAVTTRTRLLASLATPVPPSERPPSGRGILIGSILGAVLVSALAGIPWPSAAPPPAPIERERPAIEAAMQQYRSAYRNRDIEAVTAVFPTLPAETRQTMRRAFARCLVYEVTFDGMLVNLEPDDETLATVDLRSSHTCTPNSGGRQTTTSQREIISLRKSGDTWLLDRADRVRGNASNRTG